MDIERKILTLVAAHFKRNVRDVHLDVNFIRDYGADSMATIEFILLCESEFGLTIPDKTALEIHSPRMAIECIKRHL